jgi:hypothetical protein
LASVRGDVCGSKVSEKVLIATPTRFRPRTFLTMRLFAGRRIVIRFVRPGPMTKSLEAAST